MLRRLLRLLGKKTDDAQAQYQLGRRYEEGNGVAQDYAQAAVCYRKASAQGHAVSQHALGAMYTRGLGVAQDDTQAVAWYRKAAEQGDAVAQSDLGFMYSAGRGVDQSDALAATWWLKSAEQGFPNAQNGLGGAYEAGRGIVQDDVLAVRWWRKAAEQGHVFAQINLASMFSLGRGVTQDHAQAAAWWHKAAEQGDATAQASLAACYAQGSGMTQDDAQAAAWWRKAAEQGHAVSQTNLGALYMDGRGVAKDEAQAAAWWRQAAEQGNELAISNLEALRILERSDATEAAAWLRSAGEYGDADAERLLTFSKRVPAVGGIESLVLDGTIYFFGFDFRSDSVLSMLFDDIDAMALYASLNMLQADGKHDAVYWRALAEDSIRESELSPNLESRTFSSHDLASISRNLHQACQSDSPMPGFSIDQHLLYLLGSAGGWEADTGDIEGDIRIIAGARPLTEGERICQVAQRLQAQLSALIRSAPGNWRELFAALSPE